MTEGASTVTRTPGSTNHSTLTVEMGSSEVTSERVLQELDVLLMFSQSGTCGAEFDVN